MSQNYFSHDSNARNSKKIINLRMKLRAEGYGVYFMLLERLREEEQYMSVKDYNMLAFDLRVDSSIIKSVIEDFGLFVFTSDDKYFYSEGFNERMLIKDAKKRKLSEAGKSGMASKWGEPNHRQTRSERLRLAREKGTHTSDEWEELKAFFGECVICGKKDKIVKDHIMPIYQGGSDSITNLQPLCSSCNSSKGADNKDYRVVFCESKGLGMPNSFLENALQMPNECLTSKEKESKEKKNISIEITREDREKIFKIFFFKNYENPSEEVEKFINHYQSQGWCKKSGAEITDVVALAESWKSEQDKRLPVTFLAMWKELYNELNEAVMLSDFKVKMADGKLQVYASVELRDVVESHADILQPIFQKHLSGYVWGWIIKK